MLEAVSPKTDRFRPLNTWPTLGADPEVFVMHGKKLIPAFEFLKPKDSPERVGRIESKNDLYWDGFQGEFAFPMIADEQFPHTCIMVNGQRIQSGLAAMNLAAKRHNANARLTLKSVVKISDELLANSLDPHVILGCEPSFNAYKAKGQEVANPRKLKYRFAGGHMHFGCEYVKTNIQKTVRFLDKILGVWSVGAAQSFDNPIRRQYYGLAGEYRTPAHGLEYRVLSNFWLSHPVIYNATWEIARAAFLYANEMGECDYWNAPEEMVQEAINNGDVKLAATLLKLNKPVFNWLFGMRGWEPNVVDYLFDIGLNGIESAIKEPEAIAKNWSLDTNPDYHGIVEIMPNGGCNSRWTLAGHARAEIAKGVSL